MCGMSDETCGDATWDEKCGSNGLPEVEAEKTDSNRKSDAGKYPKNNGIINQIKKEKVNGGVDGHEDDCEKEFDAEKKAKG